MNIKNLYINLFHSETDHVGESTTFVNIRIGGMFREKDGGRRYFQKVTDTSAIEVVLPSQNNKHGYMGKVVNFNNTVAVIKCRARLGITFMEGI